MNKTAELSEKTERGFSAALDWNPRSAPSPQVSSDFPRTIRATAATGDFFCACFGNLQTVGAVEEAGRILLKPQPRVLGPPTPLQRE